MTDDKKKGLLGGEPLDHKYQKLVDEMANEIFYHNADLTQRERLRRCLTLFAELVLQDIALAALASPTDGGEGER